MADKPVERVEHADPRLTPTVGKIVHYTDGEEVYAAILTRIVKKNVAHLTIFDPDTGPRSLMNITGTGTTAPAQGQWNFIAGAP